MKRIVEIVLIAFACTVMAAAGMVCAQTEGAGTAEVTAPSEQPQPQSTSPDPEKDKIVKGMVESAIAKFKEKGVDYTLKLLNASSGPFRNGPLYVFAADFKGVNLAHPAKRSLVGKNAWKLQGAKGKYLVQEMIKVAKDPGKGWVEYWWMRTGEDEPVLKRAYVERVPGEDIWLGAAYVVE